MGDPKKLKKRYETPSHPWQGERIKEEKGLMVKYGLKNKREVWKAQSYLRRLRKQAVGLQAMNRTGNDQSQKETGLLLKRCHKLGFLSEGAPLKDVLAIDVEMVFSRRLQSLVYTKGLAQTPKQARQMINHGHIILKDRRVTIPGLLVNRFEEGFIEYEAASPYSSELHPMRPKGTAPSEEIIPSQVEQKITIEAPKKEEGEK